MSPRIVQYVRGTIGGLFVAPILGWLFMMKAFGAQIHVPTQWPTVQQGIVAATNGDTVLVAPGIYNESINFLGKEIVVKSSGGPAVTVIDSHLTNRVVTITGTMSRNARLEGFTVRNGAGGIYIQLASPTVVNNLIISNSACEGIGLEVDGGAALIVSNVIAGNYSSGCSGGMGGGISVAGAGAVEVIHNVITNNYPGGIEMNGAGPAVVRGNTIGWNTGSLTSWGGMTIFNYSAAYVANNLIVSNIGIGIMSDVPSGYRGPYIINNTIVDNQGTSISGIYSDGFDSMTLFANNVVRAFGTQAAMYVDNFDSSVPIMRNNVFYSVATPYGGMGPNPIGQNGNVSTAPAFLDPDFMDYRLQTGSAIIDIGSNSDAPTNDIDLVSRPYDGNGDGISRVDPGAYEWIPHPPPPPRLLVGVSVNLQTTISWRASPEANLYNLMRSTTSGGPYSLLQTLSATNYVDSDVVSNATYYYTVNANNSFGQSSNSVEVAVRAGNFPPIAMNDTVSTPEDTATNVAVLVNDTDSNNDTLAIASFTQPAHGKVVLSGSSLTYTPATNINGGDSFTYVVADGRWGFSTGQVSVVLTPVDDPPSAANLSYIIDANSAGVTVTPAASDPEGDPSSFQFLTAPTNGLFDVNTLVYRPAHGFRGVDSMTYQATDGQATGNVATIFFFVRPTADTNHDGIPDIWANQHGITSRDADDDLDGFSNYQEYLANTDPLNSGSALRLSSIQIETNGFPVFSWDSIGGTRYRVQYRNGLSGAFSDIYRPVTEEMDPSFDGLASTMRYMDTNPPSAGVRFYRIKTVTQ